MSREGYYSLDETAEASGESLNVIAYHRRLKAIPEPGRWGGRRVYTQDQYDLVVKYFAGRKKYQRQKEVV